MCVCHSHLNVSSILGNYDPCITSNGAGATSKGAGTDVRRCSSWTNISIMFVFCKRTNISIMFVLRAPGITLTWIPDFMYGMFVWSQCSSWVRTNICMGMFVHNPYVRLLGTDEHIDYVRREPGPVWYVQSRKNRYCFIMPRVILLCVVFVYCFSLSKNVG